MEKASPSIILIQAPPWGVQMPPLSLALLASACRNKGISCSTLDLNIKAWSLCSNDESKIPWDMESQNRISAEDCLHVINRALPGFIKKCADEIVKVGENPIIAGFSVNSRNAPVSLAIAREVKKINSDINVVFGGPEALNLYTYRGRDGAVDFWALGEGEELLPDLYEALVAGVNSERVPGVIHSRRHSFKPSELLSKRVVVNNLKEIPDADFSSLLPAPYTTDYIPSTMSRGCIGSCNYCIDRVISGRLRLRDADSVVKECLKLKEKYNCRHIEFNDLLCNGSISHLKKICTGLVASGTPVSWSSYAMIRDVMTPELLSLMYKAGCRHISYGLESGSSRVLKDMGKYYDAEIAARVLKDTSEAGIAVSVNIIVGYPGEGSEGIRETIMFLEQNKDSIQNITNLGTCFVCPGSNLELCPAKFGISLPKTGHLSSWIDSDGSDDEIRQKRLEQVSEALCKIGMTPMVYNRRETSEVDDVESETQVFPVFKKQNLKVILMPDSGVEELWMVEAASCISRSNGSERAESVLQDSELSKSEYTEFNSESGNRGIEILNLAGQILQSKWRGYLTEASFRKSTVDIFQDKNTAYTVSEIADKILDFTAESDLIVILSSMDNIRTTDEIVSKVKSVSPSLSVLLMTTSSNTSGCSNAGISSGIDSIIHAGHIQTILSIEGDLRSGNSVKVSNNVPADNLSVLSEVKTDKPSWAIQNTGIGDLGIAAFPFRMSCSSRCDGCPYVSSGKGVISSNWISSFASVLKGNEEDNSFAHFPRNSLIGMKIFGAPLDHYMDGDISGKLVSQESFIFCSAAENVFETLFRTNNSLRYFELPVRNLQSALKLIPNKLEGKVRLNVCSPEISLDPFSDLSKYFKEGIIQAIERNIQVNLHISVGWPSSDFTRLSEMNELDMKTHLKWMAFLKDYDVGFSLHHAMPDIENVDILGLWWHDGGVNNHSSRLKTMENIIAAFKLS